ncbi:MAG: DegT/DnrJ/EryC1/StrS family aminotransferase [Endomicrobium sp.]|jgi:dTDP-4-amino-4,6-dideoxygalactose transaminase|nr:DegT/DnrJ/EryC1/StrS family aminotransferase [Endomicrobium sp.]
MKNLQENKQNNKTFVTQPLLPSLEEYISHLKDIWESKWLTNMGEKHNLLENRLKGVLKIKNVSLFNNGAIALLTALKALDLPAGSEVITTPFTFAATPHCISWNGLLPVFCDIEPGTMCIDPDKIENLITAKTSAILAVHVYGFPCDVEKIEKIAQKHHLKVIFDAAHAFTTEFKGKSIATFGDISMFSFHATKLFNTAEGGCLTYNNDDLVKKIYNLRNFGIQSEEIVEEIGINGKMNELQASLGLLNLELFEEEKNKRAEIKAFYDQNLAGIKGIRVPQMPETATNSYQYYPIVIEDDYPLSRNELYEKFKSINIMTRKYFYPICSDYECYKGLPSSSKENLPVTNEIKNKVLCLPFYGNLDFETLKIICKTLMPVRNQ